MEETNRVRISERKDVRKIYGPARVRECWGIRTKPEREREST
jgi:hypothetical protein